MKNYIRLQIIFLLRFFSDSIVYVFLSRYFLSLGFNGIKLGILLAVHPFMSIIGNLVFSKLAKNNKTNILLLIIMGFIEATAMCLLGFASAFWLVLLVLVFMTSMNSAYFSIADGVASFYSEKAMHSYGGIRIFGSIAYLIGTTTSGLMLENIGFKFVFLIGGGLIFITSLLLMTITDKEESINDVICQDNSLINIDRKLFINFMLFFVLVIVANNISDNVFGIFTEKVYGVSNSKYSLYISLQILMEIIVMLLVSRFGKKGHYKLYLIIASAILLSKNLILCFNLPELAACILFPFLRGTGWGFFVGLRVIYIRDVFGEQYVTKIVCLQTMLVQFVSFIMLFVSPMIYENTSFNIYFVILTSLSFLGLIFGKTIADDKKTSNI